jgi:hypothetical protein
MLVRLSVSPKAELIGAIVTVQLSPDDIRRFESEPRFRSKKDAKEAAIRIAIRENIEEQMYAAKAADEVGLPASQKKKAPPLPLRPPPPPTPKPGSVDDKDADSLHK